ncbi:MAG TPA: hypothetical protein VJR89_26250 [Polyangiales bacterium]|nr:hypothetical protein [Polyangiales bacterium]
MKSLRNSLGLLGALAALAACEQIIGLEDRVLVEDASVAPTEDTQLCKRYCDDVMAACSETDNDAYTSKDNCLAMCAFMPQGKSDASDTSKNTASCRANAARQARNLEGDPKQCVAAAPGGGSSSDNPRCGDICESYCGLYDAICSDSKQANCLAKCRALPDTSKYDAETDYRMVNDTIQCRMAHLNAAAQGKRDDDDSIRTTHCGHAVLRASLASGVPCDLPDGTTPSCKDYCKLVTHSCSANKVYDSAEQCEQFCENGLVKGTNTYEEMVDGQKMVKQDVDKDTLACRRWHAYFAFGDASMAAVHCKHSGPTGDGHCGKNCNVYCPMLERGCKDQFAKEFPGGQSACLTACKAFPGVQDAEMGYSVDSEEARTNTLQCRFRHLVDVFNGMPSSCDRAFLKGTCSH